MEMETEPTPPPEPAPSPEVVQSTLNKNLEPTDTAGRLEKELFLITKAREKYDTEIAAFLGSDAEAAKDPEPIADTLSGKPIYEIIGEETAPSGEKFIKIKTAAAGGRLPDGTPDLRSVHFGETVVPIDDIPAGLLAELSEKSTPENSAIKDKEEAISYAAFKLKMGENTRTLALAHLMAHEGNPKATIGFLKSERQRALVAQDLETVHTLEREIDVIGHATGRRYPKQHSAEKVVHALEHSRDSLHRENHYRRSLGRMGLRKYVEPDWVREQLPILTDYKDRSNFREDELRRTSAEAAAAKEQALSRGKDVVGELPPVEVEVEEPVIALDESDPLIKSLVDAGVETDQVAAVAELLKLDEPTLIARALKDLGIDDLKIAETTEMLMASPVRLTMKRLHELGLPEDAGEPDSRADEAHKILVSEEGRLQLKHILDLGFDANRVEEVHALLTSKPAELLKRRLEMMGFNEATISELIAVPTKDKNAITKYLFKKLGFDETTINKVNRAVRAMEQEETMKGLGYEDETLLKKAEDLGISNDNLTRGKDYCISIEDLIAAAEGDPFWLQYLAQEKINITPASEAEAVDESGGDAITSSAPTQSSILEQINDAPGRLRLETSLLGNKWETADPIGQRLLAFPNFLYRKLRGERRIADEMYWEHRNHGDVGVRGNYGIAGTGRVERDEYLKHVRQLNIKTKEARRKLARHFRHNIMGKKQIKERRTIAHDILSTRTIRTKHLPPGHPERSG